MTKTKRITAIAVSVVLAGTLAVSLTACGKKNKAVNSYGEGVVNMALAEGTTLNVAIGYNSDKTGMFYGADTGTNLTFAGGYQANNGDPKPATQAIMDQTGINLVDRYSGSSTSANLGNLVDNNSWGDTVDMATSDLSVAAAQATNGSVLNLAEYLDYMPNFKAFLEENPIVYLSILQGNMDPETGEGQELYVAPYFDGMDDIEKGCLMRQDWIEDVLDYETWNGSTTATSGAQDDTFASACYVELSTTTSTPKTAATETSATSYMGTTGSWSIESTAEPEATTNWTESSTITVTKNYDDALDALESNSGGSELYDAWSAIAGTGAKYDGDSGNIVDIMNAALESNETGAKGLTATGEDLAQLYKAYIATAYTVDEEQYYGTESVPYSKVFTGYSACWDVDDLVALLRIIKCSSGQVGLAAGQKTTGIFPRDYSNSRTPDIISLVGELYGCRGATSRYENTYIDSDGTLQDARNDVKFWDALTAFGGLAAEGLIDGGYVMDGVSNSASNTYLTDMHGSTQAEGVGFMQWDYSQTQTTHEFDLDDMNYGWVNTPVSLWDDGSYVGDDNSDYSYKETAKTEVAYTDGTNNSTTSTVHEKYMRFTDSWRSTKTAGLVVASSVTKDENKLAAALSFVDYLYSNDGQITTTYAIQDTTENSSSPNGQWYGESVEGGTVSSETYGSCFEETYQYVIKDEFSDNLVVYNGLICDKDGNPATDENGDDISGQVDVYAEKISSYSVASDYENQYFAFGGQLYEGTLYKGKMTPIITDELFEHFTGTATDGYGEFTAFGSDIRGNFTNYARYVLGSTLPICVKDQSFENQMTAKIASEDATRVGVSIGNGTINHCELTITENQFYTCVPTGFPLTTQYQNALGATTQNQLLFETGTSYDGKSSFWSMYHYIIWYGWDGSYTLNNCNVPLGTVGGSVGMVSRLNSEGLQDRLTILRLGWDTAKSYWDFLSK